MNTVSITDKNFIKTEIYKNFINENPGSGTLMIRALRTGTELIMPSLPYPIQVAIQ